MYICKAPHAFAIKEDRAKALLLSTLTTFSETIGSQRKCEAAMGSSLTALLLFSLFLSLVIYRADMETTTLKGIVCVKFSPRFPSKFFVFSENVVHLFGCGVKAGRRDREIGD